jgi:hypothetical protein
MARLRKVKEGIASQNKRRELQTLTRAYSQVHTHSGRERERGLYEEGQGAGVWAPVRRAGVSL